MCDVCGGKEDNELSLGGLKWVSGMPLTPSWKAPCQAMRGAIQLVGKEKEKEKEKERAERCCPR